MADNELSAKLARRQQRMEDAETEMLPDQTRAVADTDHCVADSADDELRTRLNRRQVINDGGHVAPCEAVHRSVYAEFHEFTRKQIKQYEGMFKKFDENGDGHIDFEELKKMMEKLGAPQTHLSLKQMIKEVDEDQDNKISLREFLLIFRKAAAGELLQDSGLSVLAQLSEIDVAKEGVGGAKHFFEAKIDQISRGNAFEAEIKQEQVERRQKCEEKKQRQQDFRAKQAVFLQ